MSVLKDLAYRTLIFFDENAAAVAHAGPRRGRQPARSINLIGILFQCLQVKREYHLEGCSRVYRGQPGCNRG